MMLQLGVHRTLNQCFGQLLEQALWPGNLFRRLAGQ